MQGYWTQNVYIGEKKLLRIEHSLTEKEQSLIIEQSTGYAVAQIDRNLDGKYEMLLIVSLKDETLMDVLILTEGGWLRHSTTDEFSARLRVGDRNRKDEENFNSTITNVIQQLEKDVNK